jgi:ribosome-associated toxin RatA of RatAB toxin-antitoxin module
MTARTLVALVATATLLVATGARADEMARLLKDGPLVRIESNGKGRFKQGLAVADIDASADQVWAVLTDFDKYRFFMPRVDELEVSRAGKDWEVAFKLDTPFVSTSYTNRYTLDEAARTINVRQVRGDLDGSHFHWRVVKLGEKRTRLYYRGVVKNFSSIAQRLEDDQQTITVGINVVSLLSAIKAIKTRSEALYRQTGYSAPQTTLQSGG